MIVKIQPSTISGIIKAPASKSSMQRACAAALLRKGKSIIHNPGRSNDDKAAMQIIKDLGAELIINNEELIIDENCGITKTDWGYRFWPDKVKGEGFFIACLRKLEGEDESYFKTKNKIEITSQKEKVKIQNWVKQDELEFVKHENTIYAWPENLVSDFNILLLNLRVIYSGTLVGQLMRDKLIPDHALAMSKLVNENIPRLELNYQRAIEYLQKKDLKIETKNTGWQLVTYKDHLLGWVNVLPNRINNYYPKELRILKDMPDLLNES